jgi:hypothetical protein
VELVVECIKKAKKKREEGRVLLLAIKYETEEL